VILLPRAVKAHVALEPANLRRSFDGLLNEVRSVLGADPLRGHVFVFLNRRRNQVKLLVWTRGGFTVVHKRLERGTFAFPAQRAGRHSRSPLRRLSFRPFDHARRVPPANHGAGCAVNRLAGQLGVRSAGRTHQ
jgi:transposase